MPRWSRSPSTAWCRACRPRRMTLAAAPEALQGAVAAGILGCGSVVLGSSEAAGRFFAEIAAQIGAGAAVARRPSRRWCANTARPSAPFPATVTRCTRAPIRAPSGCSRSRAKPASPGATSRSPRRSSGCCRSSSARPLALNVSGAIPAVLLDAGYPLAGPEGRAAAGAHRRPGRAPARGAAASHRLRHVARRRAGDRLRRRGARRTSSASEEG